MKNVHKVYENIFLNLCKTSTTVNFFLALHKLLNLNHELIFDDFKMHDHRDHGEQNYSALNRSSVHVSLYQIL